MTTHEEKVRQFLTQMNSGDGLEEILKEMGQMFIEAGGPPDIMEAVHKAVNKDAIVEGMIPFYVNHLTESDIDALLTFYSSDVGKKWRELTPKILAEAQEIGRSRMQEALMNLMFDDLNMEREDVN